MWHLSGASGTPFILPLSNFYPETSTFVNNGDNPGGATTVQAPTNGYYNLTFDNAAETYNAAGNFTVAGVLDIANGVFSGQTMTITLSGASGQPSRLRPGDHRRADVAGA